MFITLHIGGDQYQVMWWGGFRWHPRSAYKKALFGVYEWRMACGPVEVRKFLPFRPLFERAEGATRVEKVVRKAREIAWEERCEALKLYEARTPKRRFLHFFTVGGRRVRLSPSDYFRLGLQEGTADALKTMANHVEKALRGKNA